ncbi:MAG TPA: PspC domain-containing protein [Candidatus Dormibacteraeota bacterium]|nr:PspC domain-containing protein [Candidatus Dormibacteraeota bacterium]
MQSPSDQKFYRGSDRIVGGVCSGLAEGLHVDTIWVRLAFVVLAFAQGIGVLVYLVLWVIMPERAHDRPAGRSAFDSMADDVKRAWADLRGQFGSRPPASASPYTTGAPAPPPVHADPSAPAAPQATQLVSPPPATTQPLPPATPRPALQNQSMLLGVILVLIGLAFLSSNTGLVNWSVIWPVVLIAFGIVLLIRNLERRR